MRKRRTRTAAAVRSASDRRATSRQIHIASVFRLSPEQDGRRCRKSELFNAAQLMRHGSSLCCLRHQTAPGDLSGQERQRRAAKGLRSDCGGSRERNRVQCCHQACLMFDQGGFENNPRGKSDLQIEYTSMNLDPCKILRQKL